MTKQEASERYQIPMHILSEYESWGLCGAVKEVMGAWLQRLDYLRHEIRKTQK